MTGYRIENRNDRTNAFSDAAGQLFESLEDARSWADVFWDGILESSSNDDPAPCKDDYIISFRTA